MKKSILVLFAFLAAEFADWFCSQRYFFVSAGHSQELPLPLLISASPLSDF